LRAVRLRPAHFGLGKVNAGLCGALKLYRQNGGFKMFCIEQNCTIMALFWLLLGFLLVASLVIRWRFKVAKGTYFCRVWGVHARPPFPTFGHFGYCPRCGKAVNNVNGLWI
jgi:hypothetical protein